MVKPRPLNGNQEGSSGSGWGGQPGSEHRGWFSASLVVLTLRFAVIPRCAIAHLRIRRRWLRDSGFLLRRPRNDRGNRCSPTIGPTAGRAPVAMHHGSIANFSFPAGFSVCASKLWISVAPPTSSVTRSRSPAVPVETMRAPFGSTAVTSVLAALPSLRKRR